MGSGRKREVREKGERKKEKGGGGEVLDRIWFD